MSIVPAASIVLHPNVRVKELRLTSSKPYGPNLTSKDYKIKTALISQK